MPGTYIPEPPLDLFNLSRDFSRDAHSIYSFIISMYTPFAHAFAYAIKQTPYAFLAKIMLCMYFLYAATNQFSVFILATKCN